MQQNQQMQQDPVVQMQQMELEIKKMEVERKALADKLKAVLEAAKLEQKNEADKSRQTSQEKIAGAALGVKIMQDKAAYIDTAKDRMVDAVLEAADIASKHKLGSDANDAKLIAAKKPTGGAK